MKNALTTAVMFISLLMLNLFPPMAVSQTQISPDSQIRWSTPITSSTTGPQSKFYNSIPQADQFPGAPDACLQVRNAEVYALNSGINQVDATHFFGQVACHTDMFGALNATGNASVNLAVNFGAVHLLSTVQQHITNSGLHIHGLGGFQTQLEYTGTSTISQILYVDGTTGSGSLGANGLNDFKLEGLFVYGDTISGSANAVDAIQMVQTHRSKLEDVMTWGVSGCGIHTRGAVTDTFYRPHVSVTDAFFLGIQGTNPYPANGLCFDSLGSNQTTDGTVIDAITEGLTNIGWYLESANSMHFSSGTSEGNNYGIKVLAGSKWNTFTSPDIEQNAANVSGVDITDNGQTNFYINAIASSTCSSCNSALAGGGGGQYILGEAGFFTSFTGSWAVLGVNSDIGALSGSGGLKAGYISSGRTTNAVGFQSLQVAGCAITSGAIGNQCSNTFTFLSIGGVVEPDAQYKVVCSAQGGNGVWTIGNMTAINTTGFIIPSVALTSSATGNGTVNCLVNHN